MKAVLISIQPYWVFLIIARLMGWNIPQEKTIEVRKDFPKASDWDKRVHIYCSKNKKSFNRIPKEYQPFMEKLLGKVIGSFVCDKVERFTVGSLRCDDIERMACLSYSEMLDYFYKPNELDGKMVKFGYGWNISDIKIYNTPKELGEFYIRCGDRKIKCDSCKYKKQDSWFGSPYCEVDGYISLTHPFQSWGYVDEL